MQERQRTEGAAVNGEVLPLRASIPGIEDLQAHSVMSEVRRTQWRCPGPASAGPASSLGRYAGRGAAGHWRGVGWRATDPPVEDLLPGAYSLPVARQTRRPRLDRRA